MDDNNVCESEADYLKWMIYSSMFESEADCLKWKIPMCVNLRLIV